MRSNFFFPFLALALLLGPSGTGAEEAEQAQRLEAPGQQHLLTIELNRVQQSQSGCRLSFMAVNKMGADLQTTALEIVFFDAEHIVSQMLLLDFGRLPSGKTKVVEFDLPQDCGQISRVLVNDIVECASADEQNMTQDCFNGLRTSNRAAIEFGI